MIENVIIDKAIKNKARKVQIFFEKNAKKKEKLKEMEFLYSPASIVQFC